MERPKNNLVKDIESISEQIQVLALNIAVAAARMAFKKELSQDINNKLSRLVNQATQAVKNMGYILKAARSERPKQDIFANGTDIKVDSAMIADIEESLQFILEDSRKIMQMLDSVKQRSLDDFRST